MPLLLTRHILFYLLSRLVVSTDTLGLAIRFSLILQAILQVANTYILCIMFIIVQSLVYFMPYYTLYYLFKLFHPNYFIQVSPFRLPHPS